jgi:hypothetical protein
LEDGEEAKPMDGKEQFRSLIFCISSQAARAALAVAVVFALTVGLARLAQAQTETVLYDNNIGSTPNQVNAFGLTTSIHF